MKKYQVGEFEEIVMLTICILQSQAYGVSIQKEIEMRLQREASMGALHSALIRLEEKGFLKSKGGESSEGREGRPRRYYEVTALGRKALDYIRKNREQLWSAIPNVAVKAKFTSF
ncbi:MAG TPA: helix-turn-helix transcriptional regulator [Chryseolinea sp.]|nr:helix-turn-helix transcriptional regulator [Chryseolinea sp.]